MGMGASILIVDDDPGSVRVLAGLLGGLGEILVATSGVDALGAIRRDRPDLVLLDAEMPGLSGFEVCRTLKADPELADIPVIFVTANRSSDFEVSGFEHGAADYIGKPVIGPLVRARVMTQLKIKRLTDELRRLATEDPLTGLANRRRFDEALRRDLASAQRSGLPLTLLLIDIDHFKAYNDHFGHPAGDDCLRAVAHAVAAACRRPTDLVARIGGEEFAVLLPQTPAAASMLVAEHLRAAVAALDRVHPSLGECGRVSVSIGGVTLAIEATAGHADAAMASRLISAADVALYRAKQSGRDRACFGGLDA